MSKSYHLKSLENGYGFISCVSAEDSNGRTIFVADAHRDDGKRFCCACGSEVDRFYELESAARADRQLPASPG